MANEIANLLFVPERISKDELVRMCVRGAQEGKITGRR